MDRQYELEKQEKANFGFWIYLMTDLLMFAVFFAAFAVLRNNTFGGPSGADIFDLNFVLAETLILLTSSFVCGLAVLAMNRNSQRQMYAWFALTFILGLSFLAMEISEFTKLVAEGNSWTRSGFLSSYFTLVGAHGMHIAVGLLWMAISVFVVWLHGLTENSKSKLARLAVFWHFLDLVWIFIFSVVYLMGAAIR